MPEFILPKPFNGSEDGSFLWKGMDRAALLVHGFPGTPAEMRPLGTVLREAGWTVHGLMLPGLGADIESLDKRSFHDWLDAVGQAVAELKREHSAVMLVGYSMGGALALHAAMEHRPAGLVLLAPFWRFGGRWTDRLWPVMRLVLRRVKPLQHADFSAVEVRHGLQRMFRNVDLDNPDVQKALRQLTASLAPIEQIRRLGRSAFERAATTDVPTLVVQGNRDTVVPPFLTKRLIDRFPNRVQYQDVNAGHDLVDPEAGAWIQVKDCLLHFAESIRERAEKNPGDFVSDSVVTKNLLNREL